VSGPGPLVPPARRLARALRVPAGVGAGRRVVERNVTSARRSAVVLLSGFAEPVFYLFSLGVGLGALIGPVQADGRDVGYAQFVAPALLATSAMNGAVMDSTFNVFWKLKYAHVYDAMLATPLGPRDVAVGEITWALLRGGLYAAMFLAVMALAGLVSSWWALLAVPAALLVGFAFAGAGMAATTFMRSWQDFELVTLVTLPLLLFSATFYPVTAYPGAVRAVVAVTPLYHGVELLRSLTLGTVDAGILGHVAYLLAMGAAGLAVAGSRLERLLLT